MSDIGINSSNTELAVAELINRIRTEIIDAGQTSCNKLINTVEHSAGDFMESFKTEIARETETMNAVGELLIAMANYIQAAANAFMAVDMTYNTSRFETKTKGRTQQNEKHQHTP